MKTYNNGSVRLTLFLVILIPVLIGFLTSCSLCGVDGDEEGVFINPVIPPACAPTDTLVRVALMATHTKEQVDLAVEKLSKVFRELGVIK